MVRSSSRSEVEWHHGVATSQLSINMAVINHYSSSQGAEAALSAEHAEAHVVLTDCVLCNSSASQAADVFDVSSDVCHDGLINVREQTQE